MSPNLYPNLSSPQTYGSSSGFESGAHATEHSIDTGLAFAGNSYASAFVNGGSSSDMMLVKTDSVGALLWSRTYGGTLVDDAQSVIEHSTDNGFILFGRSTSFGIGIYHDTMLVKTNSVGGEIWTKTYGGSNYEYGYSVIEHSIDNGLVLLGVTHSYTAAPLT
jgi:hypothetical protein